MFRTVICEDADEMARLAAERIAEYSRTVAEERLSIALAGGNTPKRLYETLAQNPYRENVNWDRLEFFFGDERAVPETHPDSNYGMARDALLSKVPVISHRMAADLGDADSYEKLISEKVPTRQGGIPVFDLILLGIGKDGHTASLFPGTGALRENGRWVVMNEVPQLNTRRMTFTYPLINAARRVWVMAAGADKREIVEQCLAARSKNEFREQWPVTGVHPDNGELLWWLDKAAAGMH